MIQKRVRVSGRVQGVGFRASTVSRASQFPELLGYVKNLADGRVEAVFAGNELEVDAMVEWCRRGPPSANVAAIEIIEEPVSPALKRFLFER